MDRRSKPTRLFGKLTVLLTALAMLTCLLPQAVLATEGCIELTGNTVDGCKKGDTVTVSLTIPAESCICDFTALIRFDAALLKPVQTQNPKGETVWVDTEVFTAGISANPVEGEGIRVAGATAQAGYREGGKLLVIRFQVLEDLPEAGTQVNVSFSVFHVAKTADATEETSVSVTPAKLTPGGKTQEQPPATTQPTEPATQPTEPATQPAEPVTQPGGSGTEPPAVPSTGNPETPSQAPQPSAEPTTVPQEPAPTTEDVQPTEEPAETTAPASTQPDRTEPATIPETTAPNGTQPSGGTQAPAPESPVGVIAGVCGAAVVTAILAVVFLKRKKQKEAN